MGIRRALAGAVLALAGTAVLALPAAAAAPADPYGPPPTSGLQTNRSAVRAGGCVVVTGTGYAAGATITITVRVVSGFAPIRPDSGAAPMGVLLSAGSVR